jgi:hypothetical protein
MSQMTFSQAQASKGYERVELFIVQDHVLNYFGERLDNAHFTSGM